MRKRGDIFDVKKALQAILSGPRMLNTLTEVVAEKQEGLAPPDPKKVYTEERLTKLIFPMCEILAFRSRYKEDTDVKEARHTLGIRWSVIEEDEEAATRSIEFLSTATVDLLWDESESHSGLLSDFNINAGPITVMEEDFSPMLPTAEHAFMKSVTVMIQLSTWRD